MLITLVILFLCITSNDNLPANRLGKRAMSETSTVAVRISTNGSPSKRSTIQSSFKPITTKRTAQPLNINHPPQPHFRVTPESPIDSRYPGPTPLHVMSATPLKPMTSFSEDVTRPGPLDPDFFEPHCVCCCHETEIHVPIPPMEPVMLPPLKMPSCVNCCNCKCSNCTCQSGHVINAFQPPCNNCVGECTKGTSGVSFPLLTPSNNTSVTTSSDETPSSNCPPIQCSEVNCVPKCPLPTTCSPYPTNTDINCPQPNYVNNMPIKFYPPCITKCNNNYLGYLGNELGYLEGKQPTTHTWSTTHPVPMIEQFTETSRGDPGYVPIQPMPTIPAMNQEDYVVQHIVVPQPYATETPTDYIVVGSPS